MKVAFFTEMSFTGKIPRNHDNMRTEFAWMCALNAEHYNIYTAIESCTNLNATQFIDLGIVILPKNVKEFDITVLYTVCKKVAVMQEGPNWYWQDYDLQRQIWYCNTLASVNIIFTHNEIDRKYYQGLIGGNVKVLPSLMIEDAIGNLESVERDGVIIGGNFVSWYGGIDSYIVASEFGFSKVHAPSMGRRQPLEEQMLEHLPYMNWTSWIQALNKFKYGVHLMRTHAAGTFALNCAYLGIPCIGYKGLDTQEICHPDLSVDMGDLTAAKQLVEKLRKDEEFYLYCSNICKELYKTHYSEESFLKKFNV